MSGHATYDLVVNGVRTDAYVVKGAPVEATVQGPGGTGNLGTLHTNVYGDFTVGIPSPRLPASTASSRP